MGVAYLMSIGRDLPSVQITRLSQSNIETKRTNNDAHTHSHLHNVGVCLHSHLHYEYRHTHIPKENLGNNQPNNSVLGLCESEYGNIHFGRPCNFHGERPNR